MDVGDAASWATIIGTGVAALALLVTAAAFVVSVRSAVGTRQRKLRGQLREVCRDISQACDDYRISDRRRSASQRLTEASEKLKVIRDERILSPSGGQIDELQMWVWDLSTRQESLERLPHMLQAAMAKEEMDRSLAVFRENAEHVRVYVSKLAATYRRATSKMDNGNLFTYWRYRILPPFVRRATALDSPKRRGSTAKVEE